MYTSEAYRERRAAGVVAGGRTVDRDRAPGAPQYSLIAPILASFPDGLLCVYGEIVFSVSSAFTRLFGQSEADLLGQPLSTVIDGLSLAESDAAFLTSPIPDQGDSLELVRSVAGVGCQSLKVRRFPLRLGAAGGTKPWHVLVFFDETPYREAQRATEVLVEELLRADRQAALGEMTMALAHELNQPLGAIVNFAGAARRTLKGRTVRFSEVDEVLLNIGIEAARAGDVIKSLRSFLRGVPQPSADAHVDTALKVVLGFSEPAMREQAIEFQLSMAPALPPVQCDPIILQQIILNLVTNAIQAMSERPRSGRRLLIQTAAENNGMVRIDVCDTGAGLPAELGERIFEPFITTKVNGSGLGLSIVRTLVQRLGGNVEAATEANGGARFSIHLPLRQEEDGRNA